MSASPGIPSGKAAGSMTLQAAASWTNYTSALSFTRYALHAGQPERISLAVARPYAKTGGSTRP